MIPRRLNDNELPGNNLWNQLVEHVRAITPQSGNKILVRTTPSGTTFEPIERATPGTHVPSASTPWQVFQWTPPNYVDDPENCTAADHWAWRNVRVHIGYVNGQTTDLNVKVHELDPELPTGSNFAGPPATGGPFDILVPADTTDYKIWCSVSYSVSPGCMGNAGSITITEINISVGTDWWDGHPGEFAVEGVFNFEIATVTTTTDELAYTNCPTNTVANPDYPPVLTITQIATTDRSINYHDVYYVNLVTDGGSAGDKDTACTFTYKCTDVCGNILGALQTPLISRARIVNAPVTAATKGTMMWTADGTLSLVHANETLAQNNCT